MICIVVLEFFIKVTQVKPQLMFTTYPKVFVVLYETLKEGEDSLVGVAINSISTLASSWDCKVVLDVPVVDMTYGCQGEILTNLSTVSIII